MPGQSRKHRQLRCPDKEALPEEILPKLQAAEAKLTTVKAEARTEAVRELATYILDVSKVATSKYKAASANAFKEALKAAEQALRNPASTTEALKAASAALEKAYNDLVPRAANPMTVKGKTKVVRYSRLRKATQKVSRKRVLTIKKKKGKLTYKKVSGNRKITINKKTGVVTVRKGLKKGLYKIRVKVRSSGGYNYKVKTVTRTFKIRVK